MKKSRRGNANPSKMGPSKTVLEDSPSHLLHRVLQIALDIYNAETGEGALTQRQYAVLKALDASDGLSQTDLVRLTGIDRSTLAELVSRMLQRGYLKRERSATDARANLVQLDAAGRQAINEMHPRVLAADEKILSLLSPPKRDSFVKLLRKITTAREEELAAANDVSARRADKVTAKAEKKAQKKEHKKAHKKDDTRKLAKKLRKLPMPALSEGAVGSPSEEPVVAPVELEASA
ncbi:MAG TPA: MarR family winged helix-turn-helix transcriptional regulator [Asticcacaulis sp.]|nr:MarR family winged helix-turn-helix transcriptional regulator [Asticcacaulis sp.]